MAEENKSTGGWSQRGKQQNLGPRHGQQRDVYLSDPEHFVIAADPGECDRLPRTVRQRESDGDCGACDRGDGGEYRGGGGVL